MYTDNPFVVYRIRIVNPEIFIPQDIGLALQVSYNPSFYKNQLLQILWLNSI